VLTNLLARFFYSKKHKKTQKLILTILIWNGIIRQQGYKITKESKNKQENVTNQNKSKYKSKQKESN